MVKIVYIFIADGFEEIEALTVADLLRRAKIDTQIISASKTGERVVTGSHQIKVYADGLIKNIEPGAGDTIVIPGGPGVVNLKACEMLNKIINAAFLNNRLICAICAAPSLFGKYIRNKKFTCYKGYEKELVDFGGIYMELPCVSHENIITANSASAAISFSLEIIEKIKGIAAKQEVKDQILAE